MKAVLPIAFPIAAISGGVLRLFGVDPDSDEEKVTEDDIKLLVSEGHEKGIIKAGEAEMVQNVFELDEKEAGDILWQLSGLCTVMGWSLDDVARHNLEKLAARKQNGTIAGSGDGVTKEERK